MARGNLTQADHALAIEAKVLSQSRSPPYPPRRPRRRRRRRAAASSVATSAAGGGGGGGGGGSGGGGRGGEIVREIEVVEGHLLRVRVRVSGERGAGRVRVKGEW